MKSVKYNFLMNSILTVSSIIFPLITFPYISHILQASAYGSISLLQSIMGYFTMVASLGIPTYGIRACAKVRDNKTQLTKTVQELFIINELITLVCVFAYVLMVLFVARIHSQQAIYWLYLPVLGLNALGMNWLYSAMEEYRYITICSLVFKMISLVLTLVFVKSVDDLNLYVVILAFATVGSNIYNFWNARNIVSFKIVKGLDLRKHMKAVLSFFAISIAINIYVNLDAVMLGFMCDDTQVGIYHAATRIRSILLTMVTSLGTVLLPRLSYCVNDKKEFKRLIQKSIKFTSFAAIPLTMFFMIFAEPTIRILSGDSFIGGVPVLQIVMPTLIFAGLSNITGIQILTPLGQEKQLCNSVLLGAIVDFFLNLLLIPKYQAIGATIATLVAEILVLLFQCFCIRDSLRGIIKTKVSDSIVSSIISIFIVLLIEIIIPIGSSTVRMVIVSGIYFITYFLFMLVSKNEIALMLTTLMKDRIKKERTNGKS